MNNKTELQPVQDEPVLRLETEGMKALILADLHVGIEKEFSLSGISLPSQTEKLLGKIKTILKRSQTSDLIILGDLQHVIPIKKEEERAKILREQYWEVHDFLRELRKWAKLHLLLGNHDGGIDETLIGEFIRIYPSSGIRIGDVGLFHGHAWPSTDVMESSTLVVGHSHPAILLRDSYNYQLQERCWIRGEIKSSPDIKRYPGLKKYPSTFIIMPAFNPLCGGIAVNRQGVLGPIKNFIDLKNAEVFLLDGINLGKLSNL
ncbi:MAG TPA: metallophosphoesterase [Thermoplasmata archaeon]|nr:metallophosphoesterase [Thermoplasmata archaeon]